MIDHDQQQILRKLDDDALAEARRKAQEDAKVDLSKPEPSQVGEPVNTDDTAEEGLDENTVTY